MWHYFVPLPIIAKVGSLLALAALAVWGWAKRRTLGLLTSTLSDAAGERFWTFVRRKVNEVSKPNQHQIPTNERTYRGVFQGYAQHEPHEMGYPVQRFLTILDGGTVLKIPVAQTNLFAHLHPGQFVEVDTRIGIFNDREVVQRVRLLQRLG